MNGTRPAAAALTENVWANGNMAASGDSQWFRFTASAETQFIHFGAGTLASAYAQLYAYSGEAVDSEVLLDEGASYCSRTLMDGQQYYICIRPSSTSTSNRTYKIGFNKNFVPVGAGITTLGANTWAGGNIAYVDSSTAGEQWFSITASAAA